jgi:acetylglutamate kinase
VTRKRQSVRKAGAIQVVKLGGSLLEDAAMRAKALRSIARTQQDGTKMIVVHGGGKRIDALLGRLGIARKTHAGLRITDDETLEPVIAVLAGVVNKMLVSELGGLGILAAGIAGCDAQTITAEVHPPIDGIEFGHVGSVCGCNPSLLFAMIDRGILPVVASIAISAKGELLNVNADALAASVAVGARAAGLTFLTDVDGFLDANGRLVPRLAQAKVEELLAGGSVTGGMRPKLEAALGALRGGVDNVIIAGPRNHRTALAKRSGGTHLVAA